MNKQKSDPSQIKDVCNSSLQTLDKELFSDSSVSEEVTNTKILPKPHKMKNDGNPLNKDGVGKDMIPVVTLQPLPTMQNGLYLS